MSYRKLERSFFSATYKLREILFLPLLKLLARLKVTANHVTYFRALVFIVLVMYPMFVKGNLIFASIFYFFGFWLLDTVDGQLARHTKTSSDKGKFNDVFIDILGYSFFIMGLAFLGVANIFILFYHIIIHGAVYTISSVQKNENEKSDWLIKPEPNLIYFKIIAHTLIIIFLIFQINWIDLGFIILNIWMTINAIIYFIKLQKQKYNK